MIILVVIKEGNQCAGACTYTASDQVKLFASTNFPTSDYPKAACQWMLQTSTGRPIQMQFVHFNIKAIKQGHSGGCKDEIKIYNGK